MGPIIKIVIDVITLSAREIKTAVSKGNPNVIRTEIISPSFIPNDPGVNESNKERELIEAKNKRNK